MSGFWVHAKQFPAHWPRVEDVSVNMTIIDAIEFILVVFELFFVLILSIFPFFLLFSIFCFLTFFSFFGKFWD